MKTIGDFVKEYRKAGLSLAEAQGMATEDMRTGYQGPARVAGMASLPVEAAPVKVQMPVQKKRTAKPKAKKAVKPKAAEAAPVEAPIVTSTEEAKPE